MVAATKRDYSNDAIIRYDPETGEIMHCRPFNRLKTEMHRRRITQNDIAKRLKISPGGASAKFHSKAPWTLKEAYEVLRLLGYEDMSMIAEFFPAEEVKK